MHEQLPPGPALDERVCRALGWGQVLDMMLPGSFLGWPAVSTSGDVMLDAIEAMRGRGFWWRLESPFYRDGDGEILWWAGFTPLDFTGWNGRPDHRASSTTGGPHATALAILAALEPEGA